MNTTKFYRVPYLGQHNTQLFVRIAESQVKAKLSEFGYEFQNTECSGFMTNEYRQNACFVTSHAFKKDNISYSCYTINDLAYEKDDLDMYMSHSSDEYAFDFGAFIISERSSNPEQFYENVDAEKVEFIF